MITVALAQYPISTLRSWDAFSDNLRAWVKEASDQNASLLMFPEYASMELVGLLPTDIQVKLNDQLTYLQKFYTDYLALFEQLAQQYSLYILAGSFPVLTDNQEFRNRALFFGPSGYIGFQDKLIMTRFEREQWRISSGDQLSLFKTDIGDIGITICYDSEFPMLARRQAEAGADVLLVPSCTDTQAGYQRVRTGARARALENQCFVLHAALVGDAANNPAVFRNKGKSGVYCPPDSKISESGIWAQKADESPGLLTTDIDPAITQTLRQRGQVTTYTDWPKQWQVTGP
ncbi:carbon-nitrogen hydrolase family protein [Alteromonas sp. H39]|uniref:carbon-nitrogen hydrolase family protein n=1 Tax=Alteromonas sp. H39 TaxID=3389876 RepID=UPI0039DFBFAF